MTPSNSDASLVRDLVARADRRFRARDAARVVARVAPVAAVLVLVVALAARLIGWSPLVPVAALVVVAAALGLYFVVARRTRPTSDAIAARVDADASLAGELRSAHWFASRADADAWATFHVQRAAEHAGRIDWTSLYPPVRAARSWVVAAGCVVGAIALSVSLPARQPSADAVIVDGVAIDPEQLPAELRKKLEALMAAMDEGKASAAEATATLEKLKELMANIDPALQKKLEAMLRDRPLGADAQTKRKDLDAEDLAERAEKGDGNAGLPEDVRWALEDLAARLANASADRKTAEGNPTASTETGEKGLGSQQAQAEQAAAQASMQMVKEAAADPGASQMMMGGGAMGGDSRAGAGGNSGAETGAADALLIAKALRKELVEASADIKGENVTKEDIRRKTEQGKSTLGFTRVAPPAAFDRSRADAPPTVPEARRDLLQRYFIRR